MISGYWETKRFSIGDVHFLHLFALSPTSSEHKRRLDPSGWSLLPMYWLSLVSCEYRWRSDPSRWLLPPIKRLRIIWNLRLSTGCYRLSENLEIKLILRKDYSILPTDPNLKIYYFHLFLLLFISRPKRFYARFRLWGVNSKKKSSEILCQKIFDARNLVCWNTSHRWSSSVHLVNWNNLYITSDTRVFLKIYVFCSSLLSCKNCRDQQ